MSLSSNLTMAFARVKYDFAALKDSLNGWVMHLTNDQRDLRLRLMELEQRVKELETIHHIRKK